MNVHLPDLTLNPNLNLNLNQSSEIDRLDEQMAFRTERIVFSLPFWLQGPLFLNGWAKQRRNSPELTFRFLIRSNHNPNA